MGPPPNGGRPARTSSGGRSPPLTTGRRGPAPSRDRKETPMNRALAPDLAHTGLPATLLSPGRRPFAPRRLRRGVLRWLGGSTAALLGMLLLSLLASRHES